MPVENERPAFVVMDIKTGHRYEIFANGQTRGFEHVEQRAIFNHIPQLEALAYKEGARGRL